MKHKTNYTWTTTKTATGFDWAVYAVTGRDTPNERGQYADSERQCSGSTATRAQATGAAKRNVRFYRAKAA